MNTKKLLLGIGLLVVAVLAGFVGSKFGSSSSAGLGAVSSFSSGQVQYTPMIFANGLSAGTNQSFYVDQTGVPNAQKGVIEGGILSTTTPVSLTLQPADIQNITTLSDSPSGAGSITLTLPATTTAGMSTWIPNSGDTDTFGIVNATTSAFTVTVAGGTGTLLKNASTTAAIIQGGEAFVRCTRKVNTDILCYFSPSI